MTPGRFHFLASRHLDNDLSPEEFAEFEQQLAASADARAVYLELANLHSLLGLELESRTSAQLRSVGVVDVTRIIRRQRMRSMRIAAMAAAAVIVISMAGLRFFMAANRPPAISFETAPSTTYTLTHKRKVDPSERMTMRQGSRLRLSKGTVELKFASGVRSIVTAPSDIRLLEDDRLLMHQGTAWFHVPAQAAGFTVETRDLRVVDLGTEFGVRAKPGSLAEVHVFDGRVRVEVLRKSKDSTTLVAKEAVRSDHAGRLYSIPVKSSAFLTSLPPFPPYLHWSFDEADGFAVKGSHPAVHTMSITPGPADSPPRLEKGKYGSALLLDGNQQCVMTDWDGIYGADQPLSCAVWVRIPSGLDLTNYPGILGWGIPENSDAKWKVFIRQEQPGEAATACISVGTNDGMYRYRGRTQLDDNQWHHIAVVKHATRPESDLPHITLYIDGEPEITAIKHFPVEPGFASNGDIKQHPLTKPLAIGKGPVPQEITYRGLIDELYIFEGELSQEEIKKVITQQY